MRLYLSDFQEVSKIDMNMFLDLRLVLLPIAEYPFVATVSPA